MLTHGLFSNVRWANKTNKKWSQILTWETIQFVKKFVFLGVLWVHLNGWICHCCSTSMLLVTYLVNQFSNFVFSLQLNGYKIKEGWQINCNVSIPKSRLYIGSIPKTKSKDEIKEEFDKHTSMFSNWNDLVLLWSNGYDGIN